MSADDTSRVTPAVLELMMCPIGHELCRDPVVASDGHTYEYKNISTWLKTGRLSPMTGVPFSSKVLYSNVFYRQTANMHGVELPKYTADELSTELVDACINGDEERVRRFVTEYGADVNRPVRGRAPLHWAVGCNSPEAVAVLIDWGAKVDVTDKNGTTPLQQATMHGYDKCARLIEDG